MTLTNQEKREAGEAYERGVAAQRAGDLCAASVEWRRALGLNGEHKAALYNLAVVLAMTGDARGAEEFYGKLLGLEPEHRDALYNLGNLKSRQGEHEAARALYRRLIDVDAENVPGRVNLAKSYSDEGDFETAEALLREAVRIEAARGEEVHAVTEWNLSHILLRQRRWADGWRAYEARLRLPGWFAGIAGVKEWRGEAEARRVLLWNDQGIGDAIQFLRYAQVAEARGHEVWVLVQDALKRVAATVPGVAGVVGPSDIMPQFDAQAPLPSMPHRLGVARPVWDGAYVKSDARMELARTEGYRAVGLVWAGNGQHKGDARRSVALKELRTLFDVPGIDWFGLQFGEAAAQIAAEGLGEKIFDLSPRLKDFGDTAAAIASLDLVVTIDTSVAHLAGAMGVACWLMLPVLPEWRWAGTEATSVWYPSMRIFRQKKTGDWRGVAASVAGALASRGD